MATFVLVHGGGHGGWCWRPITPRLRAAGHEVYTPTLTGLGERSHLAGPDVDLDTHVADVVQVLEYEDLTDVVLAGHSYGGTVITGVADRAPGRIARLVFMDAIIPKDGEATADFFPKFVKDQVREIDGVEMSIFPTEEVIRLHYGLSRPEDLAWATPKLLPHPWKSFTQPLRLKDEAAVERIPRTMINCTASYGWRSAEWVRRMRAAERVFDLDTGHDMMITEPEKTAEILLSLA
jgi:pimeloyl-ACP methyl ester carboxylesterase